MIPQYCLKEKKYETLRRCCNLNFVRGNIIDRGGTARYGANSAKQETSRFPPCPSVCSLGSSDFQKSLKIRKLFLQKNISNGSPYLVLRNAHGKPTLFTIQITEYHKNHASPRPPVPLIGQMTIASKHTSMPPPHPFLVDVLPSIHGTK